MNGVHDMGGMHGFGPIPIKEDEPVFHHEWEGRVYGMPIPVAIKGGFRHAIERLEPALYLGSNYYERWLLMKIMVMIEGGVFTQEEFNQYLAYYRENPEGKPPRREDPEAVQRTKSGIRSPENNRREADIQPAFHIGDLVKAKNMHPAGHTRLPAYVRGKHCRVVNYYGIQLFDDAIYAGRPDEAQPLYNVRFEGQELWGESAEPNSAVYLDMWESYLEPV